MMKYFARATKQMRVVDGILTFHSPALIHRIHILHTMFLSTSVVLSAARPYTHLTNVHFKTKQHNVSFYCLIGHVVAHQMCSSIHSEVRF